jgi:hypothetical protein
MRNLLALVGAAVILVAGLGWYLGWYQLSTEPGSDGHMKVNVDVNTKNVKKSEQQTIDFLKKETSGITNPPKAVEGQPTSNPGGTTIILPKLENTN